MYFNRKQYLFFFEFTTFYVCYSEFILSSDSYTFSLMHYVFTSCVCYFLVYYVSTDFKTDISYELFAFILDFHREAKTINRKFLWL